MRTSQLSFLRTALDYMRPMELRLAVTMAMSQLPHRTYEQGGFFAERAARDCWKLKALNAFDDGLHERINRRGRILAHMQKVAVNGQIKFVESGRDCDCVDYVHPDHDLSPATLLAYVTREKRMHESADGPCRLDIVSPTEDVEHESHDRVLEAFEDGHPHHVYSSFGG